MQTLLAVLGVLLLIFMGRNFALYLADASAGNISGAIVLDLLLLRTVTSLNVMVPFALYTAVLVAFGRLYKDSEMTAFAACGVGPGRVMSTVVVLALAASALVALLSFWTSPWAHEQALRVQEQARAGTAFASVVEGQFNQVGRSGQVFYVQGLSEDRSSLRDVFIQREDRNGRLDVFSARSGYQTVDPDTGERYLVLVDGYRYQGLPGDGDFTMHRYRKNALRLQQQEAAPLRRKRWAIPSERLWDSPRPVDQAELQWRIAMPLATVMLAVLAVLLSRSSPRQGRFAKLFLAIVVFVVYYNSLGVAISWVQRGVVSPALGLWWVHAGLLALIAILAVRHWGGRWLWYRLSHRQVGGR